MTKEEFDKATKRLKRDDVIKIFGKRNSISRPAYEPEQPFAPVTGKFEKAIFGTLYYRDANNKTKVKNFKSIGEIVRTEK